MQIRLGVLVLAAGKGSRMHSDTPKVMQPLLGEPMLRYVFDSVCPLAPGRVWTVVGHGAEQVRSHFHDYSGYFVLQEEQLGTGHAVQSAWEDIRTAGISHLLVVNGDTPLLSKGALADFVEKALEQKSDLAFLTLRPDDCAAFGRVLREDGFVKAIIEAKDFDEALHGRQSGEINSGIYLFRCEAVSSLLPQLQNNNKNKEFYITDLIGFAVEQKLAVSGIEAGNDPQLLGVNDPFELSRAEELLRTELVRKALVSGVMLHAPDSVRLGPDVVLEPGCSVTGPCELYGKSRVARGARVASHCYLEDTEVAAETIVHSFCHLVQVSIGEKCIVGPFARMRPGARMEEGAHLGSYVEMKKSVLGKGAKANHLSYIGDSRIGAGTNIGAGVITCNYDGKNKHMTIIGENAFIGSNVALVAPVCVADNATVGAGSVITKDVPAGTLGLGRARQVNLPWKGKTDK